VTGISLVARRQISEATCSDGERGLAVSDHEHRRDGDNGPEAAARGLWHWFLDLVEDAVEAALGEDEDEGRPPKPLPPGGAAAPVTVPATAVEQLTIAALGARYAAIGQRPLAQVIWQDADGEVLVHLDQTKVVMFPGLILVALTLEADETGKGQLIVPFAVGSPPSPAGLLVATEQRPRGPEQLADRWGESAIAAAWLALLDLAHGLALQRGVDADGSRLIPGAIVSDGASLAVVPQARHQRDRVAGR
jgi:hypothetical protein